jgi:hypothetical protein
MVDSRVVKRPHDDHRFIKLNTFGLVVKTWLNWRPDGATRGKGRQLVGKVREWYVESRHLQGCSPPPVSVKDHSVGPREQVLNVQIAYWWYEPCKPSTRPLIDAWLYPHSFIGWLGREVGYGPADQSVVGCGLCREPFFLGEVGLFNSVDDSWKVTTYGDCP